ncbi:hypothetical protein BGZ65_003450 [Modicella reniformis]|uniref:F-box domain-containing protein n=1 Tax=Modicella reniformis TaxID=1440133 RepID=A0A9P6ML98_9FUNG|nr:hypothetical protein BGZ65_003450 [Modicella reniformis]
MNKALTLPEIIASFGLFLSKEDILVCIRVCRSWKAEFEPSLWRSFTWLHCKRSFLTPRPDTALVRRNAKHIRKLTIELDKSYYAPFFASQCTQLEELIFDSTLSVFGAQKGTIDYMWRNFASLVRNRPRLSRIVFHADGLQVPKIFLTALKTCPKLAVLELMDCVFSKKNTMLFLQACSTRITRLLSKHDTFPKALVFPAKMTFPHLQHLDLRMVTSMPVSTQLIWISRCPNLISLDWDPSASIPTAKFCELIPKACPNLVSFRMSIDNTDAEIARILEAIPRIEKLNINLQKCKAVQSPMVQDILRSCPNLLSICAESLKHEDLLKHPWACKKLQLFDIGLCVDTGDPREHEKQDLGPHRLVYERLSQLKDLLHLSVCSSTVPCFGRGNYVKLQLDAGFDKLQTLKKLKFFSCKLALFEALFNSDAVDCVEWMVKHWTNLETLEGTIGMDQDRATQLLDKLKEHGIKFTQFIIDDDDEFDEIVELDDGLYEYYVDELYEDFYEDDLYDDLYDYFYDNHPYLDYDDFGYDDVELYHL